MSKTRCSFIFAVDTKNEESGPDFGFFDILTKNSKFNQMRKYKISTHIFVGEIIYARRLTSLLNY